MECQFNIFHIEQTLILFYQCVFRFRQNLHQRINIQIFQRCNNRQTTDKFRDQTEFQQIFRLKILEDRTQTTIIFGFNRCAKTNRGLFTTRRNDFVETGKGTAADEQDIGCIHLQEFLLRMLTATLRRHRSNSAFHDLQQCLLNALTRHIACDGRIVGLTADFVDFVDIDDTALCALNIVIGRLQQFQNDVFNILTHITGFGQCGGIGHGERHVNDTGKGLRQIGFTATCRTNQHNVGLCQFNVIALRLMRQTLVMVMYGHRQNALGILLTNDIIIQNAHNFLRGRHTFTRLHHRGFIFLADDVHAKLDTLVTDKNGRACNQLAHFMLAFTAERAIKRILRIATAVADFAHRSFLSIAAVAFISSQPLTLNTRHISPTEIWLENWPLPNLTTATLMLSR